MPLSLILLPCKQVDRNWHLVYVKCSQYEAEWFRTRKRGQTCPRLHPSASCLQHPVQPSDGLHRPPAHRQQPYCHPQWRPPPFRSLTPQNKGFFRTNAIGRTARSARWIEPMAPVSGAIFVCGRPSDFTKSATNQHMYRPTAIRRCVLAYRIQRYTPKRSHHIDQAGAYWGTDLRYRDRRPDRDGTWVCPVTSHCCVRQIRNWPKGADAAPTGRSYNSNP